MKAYPYGGLCQYITAPADALVKLPDNVSFEAAARFGYLGTAYAAMKKLGVGPGQTFLVNGISGMLGPQCRHAGAGDGRDQNSRHRPQRGAAERVKALSPQRIEVFAVDDDKRCRPGGVDPLVAWAKSMTEGYGVDSVLDCLPPGALRGRHDAARSTRCAAAGAPPLSAR